MKNTFCYVAVRTRLELVTPCVTGMYSNQTELTHHFHDCKRKVILFFRMSQTLRTKKHPSLKKNNNNE